jgi:hypothetical protein
MAIDLPKRDPSAVTPPHRGEVTLVADQSGNPVLIDEAGGVNQPFAFNGSPVQLFEQFADPAVVPNGSILYSKLIDGVRHTFARASDGTVHQLTPADARWKIQWKDDTPGSYYGDGDTIDLEIGCIAMIQGTAGDQINVNMPAIDPSNAGKECGFINEWDKKKDDPMLEEDFRLIPDAADRFFGNPVGAVVLPADVDIVAACKFISDGVGSWTHSSLGFPAIFIDESLLAP